MKHHYDLYGFRDLDLEAARMFVESALGVRLRLRDSMYRGIYYRGEGDLAETFILERNDTSTQYPGYPVRLQVNDATDMGAIRDKLTSDPQVVLLRSKTLDVNEAQEEEE
jgi:hypothetical protein